jgi:hypothetical protein
MKKGEDCMKTWKKCTVAAIIVITVIFTSCNDDNDIIGTPGLEFTLINDGTEYSVSGGSATSGVVTIPVRYKGIPVTAIDKLAFDSCGDLTEIKIPSGVRSIGDNAFYRCANLTKVSNIADLKTIGNFAFAECTSLTGVTIPAGVTSIGFLAFSHCYSLTSITIPASVTSIGTGAFAVCPGLAGITVDENNPNYASEGGILYDKTKTTLITAPGAMQGAFTIPDGVTTISVNAFSYCNSLTSVTIPAGVTSIGNFAFYHCPGLTGITVDEGNPNYASEGGILYDKAKTSLIAAPEAIQGAVIIPRSVTSIKDYAFSDCVNLTGITIPAGVTSIGMDAFSGCAGLTSITIPAGVTSISPRMFSGCTSLTGITIPKDVRFVGKMTFSQWTDRQTIYIDGKADRAAAVSAGWDEGWDSDCHATIIYRG